MKTLLFLGISATLLIAVFGGPTEHGKRGPPKDLSDEEHYDGGNEHNPEYDHEAFLGKETAQEFDKLAPEESKRRLGIIVDRIDKDKDGFVTKEELEDWVRHVSHRYIDDSVEQQFPLHDADKDGKITLKEYYDTTYGAVEDEEAEYDSHRKLSYKQMKAREERRFKLADENGDGVLEKTEFAAFMHPEDVKRMKDVVIDEALMDMDKDKDGFVTVEEYINDLWPAWEREKAADDKEPEWVQQERDQFYQHRDKDNDKRLNRREIGDWIAPEGYDHADAEANHLIYNADKNKDKKLTKEEILSNQDLFVGSQATDFGNYLNRHDEF